MLNLNVSFSGDGSPAGNLFSRGGIDFHQMRPYYDVRTDGDGRVLKNQWGEELVQGSYINVYKGAGDRNDIRNYVARPIQTNATLRRDEWIEIDAALQRVIRDRLVGIRDLESRGLTYSINGMMNTVLLWQGIQKDLETELSMDGLTRAQSARPTYTTYMLPLPILHVDYDINARELAVSRSIGNSIGTEMAEEATRTIADSLEDSLFKDKTYTFGGGRSYSYVNFPDRNTYTITKAWNLTTTTGEDIVNDVMAMKKAANDDHYYGPFHMYIPSDYELALDKDYAPYASGNPQGITIRDRILQISAVDSISVADRLEPNNIIFVQMTSDVIQLVQGMGIENIEWRVEGGMATHFKVMTIQVPRFRSDPEGRCGLVHAKV